METQNLEIAGKADKENLSRTIRKLQEKAERLERELKELKESLAGCIAAVNAAAADAATAPAETVESVGLEAKEKEAAAAADQAPSEAPSATDSLLKELSCIDDLSLARGLSRVNRDKKVYVNLLRQFCQDVDKDIKILASAAQRRDLDGYFMQAQALNSVFENIGNQFLTDWAADLEQAASEGDVKKCRKQTRPF